MRIQRIQSLWFVVLALAARTAVAQGPCGPLQFQCNDGSCIESVLQCDQTPDCPDESDEENCGIFGKRPGTCPSPTLTADECLLRPRVYRTCDIDADCRSGEKCCFNGCGSECIQVVARTTSSVCDDDQFTCDDGECIPADYQCDDDADCQDRSDEKNCPVRQCASDEFRCDNGGCEDAIYQCDGEDDCGDNSDEKDCPVAPGSSCFVNQFECQSGDECVAITYRCDGEADCQDRSDEIACDQCNCNGHSNDCDPVTGRCQNCQHNTAGDRCERCAPGYEGDATRGTEQDCQPIARCNCNGHSNDCDSQGNCLNCQHNTMGVNCERCIPGYYGDPRRGTPSDCQALPTCNCYGHSNDCDQYGQCRNCQHNTVGSQCERCKPGFRGDARRGTPTDCQPIRPTVSCNCNGHSDQCDSYGQCLNCLHNTMGASCERCLPGFVGDPRQGTPEDCQPVERPRCNCNGHSSQCDEYGRCTDCQHNTYGPNCEFCLPGYSGNAQRGTPNDCTRVTPDCNCNGHSTNCDGYGRCQDCQHNTYGPQCEFCLPGFTGDARGGTPSDCQSSTAVATCQCNGHSNNCDEFGRCQDCQHNTYGFNCENCLPGFTGDARGGTPQDCRGDQPGPSCNCYGHSNSCDEYGRCQDCQHNTYGSQCEYCMPGFEGDARGGTANDCQQATPSCECYGHSSQCDSSGNCVDCQHNTYGPQCEYCMPGFEGDARGGTADDCQRAAPSCDCYGHSSQCDSNGNCVDCQHNTYGRQCEYCLPGFDGDARRGTADDCRQTQSTCNCYGHSEQCDSSGNCVDCQHNTYGPQCEYCMPGFEGDARRGTANDCQRAQPTCNCYGHSNQCDSSGNCVDCQHNTYGSQCEYCLPGFSGDARGGTPNDCQQAQPTCNCNSHSDQCDANGNCVNCQHNTYGRQCELCLPGFSGDGRGGTANDCRRDQPACSCNGHSNQCDANGNCEDCQHNTYGPQCEYCLPGFAGDARRGTANDCVQNTPEPVCNCHNHASQCDSAGNCVGCQHHTYGAGCEYCMAGYVGDATIGTQYDCQLEQPACECHGHSIQCELDGTCLDCQHNTYGPQCEYCLPGFAGDARRGTANDCVQNTPEPVCNCHNHASQCDSAGNCVNCQHNTYGARCEYCQAGYVGDARGGTANDCQLPQPRCNCYGHSNQCDSAGRCSNCQHNTYGPQCEYCLPGFSGDARRGTSSDCYQQQTQPACECHGHADECDSSGNCLNCQHNTYGRQCEYCLPGYSGDAKTGTASDCVRNVPEPICNCNGHSNQCDDDGNCMNCQHNTYGPQCESCLSGYTGDARAGTPSDCVPEQTTPVCNCHSHSDQCDSDGNCVDCQHNTYGPQCEYCLPGFTGDGRGSTPQDCQRTQPTCSCHGHSDQCDESGNCQNCQHNTYGSQCEYCMPGFSGDARRGTPNDCQQAQPACNCHGHSDQCDASGNCANCQHNTYGSRCEYCMPGFSGDARVGTPTDCQATQPTCNCYGHSDNCDEMGRCLDCQHNTYGSQCEFCMPGFSGDARQGTPDDCRAAQPTCNCYGHSSSCDEYGRCQSCQHNTYGNQCEYCMPGFTGDARRGTPQDCQKQQTQPQACNCNGHSSTCNELGVCQDCQHNTYGANCEFCLPGFAGDARRGTANDCVPEQPACNCHGHSMECDANGNCVNCQHNTYGRECELCLPGFSGEARRGTPNDCQQAQPQPQCNCHGHSDQCDPSGRCLNCQHNTYGVQCELCAPGFSGDARRGTPNDCVQDQTRRCNCHGHSNLCDDLGRCMNCQHNTIGFECEECRPGFYGDARRGTPNDCQPRQVQPSRCDCNGHSEQCDAFGRCINCQHNTMGFRCEQCQPGFRGNPYSGAGCLASDPQPRCNCHGHSDQCDDEGRCLNCQHNTYGDRCENCAQGYEGDARAGTADACRLSNVVQPRPCNCYGHSDQCDENGRCLNCQHNTMGPQCEQCLPGLAGDPTRGTPNDCKPPRRPSCRCNGHSNLCDIQGICVNCQHNTMGRNCELCRPGFTGNPLVGTPTDCQPVKLPCNCHGHSDQCNARGSCLNCQHNTIGTQCEFCQPGYTGDARRGTPDACQPQAPQCNCNGHSNQCDSQGKCLNCRHNTMGDNCEQCVPGTVGDARLGTPYDCRRTLVCQCNGHSDDCDQYGRCLNCQHNTMGDRCEQCQPGFFGDARRGTNNDCRMCICNGHSSLCDQYGRCLNCQHNTYGENCENCKPGYIGDAKGGTRKDCRPVSPTRPQCQCHNHADRCDENGFCLNCEHNTEGPQCERCQAGFVGDATSGQKDACKPISQPKPCTCNGHSTTCDKDGNCLNCEHNTEGRNCERCRPGFSGNAKLATADACKPRVSCDCNGHATQCDGEGKCLNCKHNTEGAKCQKCKPGYRGDATQGTFLDCKPIPACFCNGHSDLCDNSGKCLDCKHFTEGPNCERCAPGYIGDAKKGTANDCKPKVTETKQPTAKPEVKPTDKPEVKPTEKPVVKPTDKPGTKPCECNGHSSTCDSKGQCLNCNHNTEGPHCEVCRPGYTGDATKGTAQDCKRHEPSACPMCNGHSSTCPNGRCQNCLHNTVGQFCEQCSPGFYGDATSGTYRDCKRCPCPLAIPSNQFSPTCVLDVDGKPTCTACPAGYMGRDCGTCAPGYIGNPRIQGQTCKKNPAI